MPREKQTGTKQFSTTLDTKTIQMIREQSAKTDIPMARLVERAVLAYAKRGWKG